MNEVSDTLRDRADRLANLLAGRQLRIVFAESCTAGLAAATMGTIVGISDFMCGSAVTYREATKTQWLGIRPDVFERFTAVSEPVARQMALAVLRTTPEADVAASITGHLGPNAPPDQDGLVFVGVALRTADATEAAVHVSEHRLASMQREARQREAAAILLDVTADAIESTSHE